jgi:16S rRNA processing protein RimM
MTRRIDPPGVKSNSTGSPDSGEPAYIVVGKIRRPHGVHGELVMEVLTDFPERLRPGKKVFIGEAHRPMHIANVRPHNEGALISFTEYEVREEAGLLRNQFVYVPEAELPVLPDGEFYYHELFGLSVFTENGDRLGELTEVLETGANDVYVITAEDGHEILIPAIDEAIRSVDLKSRKMVVRPPDWI